MIMEMDNRFVLHSASVRRPDAFDEQSNDIRSPEVPFSMKHRCLRYRHLVIGPYSALTVGFIKDYLAPFHFSHILKAHGSSPIMKFSSAAVTLPIGGEFKVGNCASLRYNSI
jgi:hypothetical protein